MVDADCAFFAPVTEELLFRAGRPVLRAVDKPRFWWGVFVLGWAWVSEFMTGFPVVLRRGTFRVARTALVASVRKRLAEDRDSFFPAALKAVGARLQSFDEAWLVYETMLYSSQEMHVGSERWIHVDTLPCAFTLLGHAAYLYDRQRYHVAIAHIPEVRKRSVADFRKLSFAVREPAERERCPALSGGVLHLGYWTPTIGKAVRVVESTFASSADPSAYFRIAGSLVLVGRCGDKDRQPGNASGAARQCAEVWCDACPRPLSFLLTLISDTMRLQWTSEVVAVPEACTPVQELLRRYLARWRPRPPAHRQRNDTCAWFCEHLSGREWDVLDPTSV